MSTLGYWAIRGRGQPIRYLLEYVGEKFEDIRYQCGDAPDYNNDCWISVKFTLGLDFPNIPYYMDGKVKISQTNAIMKYLARKYKLDAKTEEEQIRVDLMNEELCDLRAGFSVLCYKDNARFDINKPEYVKNIKKKLDQYEKFIGENQFIIGNNVTYIDFGFYEMMEHHRLLEPTILDGCPRLKAYMDRFEALPAIKAYLSSDRFKKFPINNTMAIFK